MSTWSKSISSDTFSCLEGFYYQESRFYICKYRFLLYSGWISITKTCINKIIRSILCTLNDSNYPTVLLFISITKYNTIFIFSWYLYFISQMQITLLVRNSLNRTLKSSWKMKNSTSFLKAPWPMKLAVASVLTVLLILQHEVLQPPHMQASALVQFCQIVKLWLISMVAPLKHNNPLKLNGFRLWFTNTEVCFCRKKCQQINLLFTISKSTSCKKSWIDSCSVIIPANNFCIIFPLFSSGLLEYWEQ